jgi:hypothetical protein
VVTLTAAAAALGRCDSWVDCQVAPTERISTCTADRCVDVSHRSISRARLHDRVVGKIRGHPQEEADAVGTHNGMKDAGEDPAEVRSHTAASAPALFASPCPLEDRLPVASSTG